MLTGIVAPIVTATLLTYFSPIVAFGVVGLAMACSAIPIMFTPNVQIKRDAFVLRETRIKAVKIMFADGLRAGSFYFTWLIALFIVLGNSYAGYGGALSLAGVVGAAVGLLTGKMVDLGNGKRALQIAFIALSIAVLARAFGYSMVWSAVLANAFAVMIWPIYATATNARIYNLARQSGCPLRYHIVAEGGWDLGTSVSCFISAALIYAGFGFFWPLLVALFGCGIGYWVMNKTYDPVAT